MIVLNPRRVEARTNRVDPMRVVKTEESISVGVMQRECVAQPVWPRRSRNHSLDLELEPMALFKMMDATIKTQKEFKRVFVRYGAPPKISSQDKRAYFCRYFKLKVAVVIVARRQIQHPPTLPAARPAR